MALDLKNISSLAELREQRKKLAVEERIAIDGVKQNYRTEKRLLKNRVKADINQVRHLVDDSVDGVQSFLQAGTESVQSLFAGLGDKEPAPALNPGIAAERSANFWDEWKLPALGSIAGLLAAILTFWLTSEDEDDEESETDEQEQSNYHPTEADEFGQVASTGPDEQPKSFKDTPYGEFERDLNLEQRIHAAMATYDDDRKEKNQDNIMLAIAGMIVPVILRELLNGTLVSDLKRLFGGDDEESPEGENQMQDLSNSIADELEKVKASLTE